jgi:hypothetical protein
MNEPVERRLTGLLLAAIAVALLTLVVVLRFGLLGPPELAAVDDRTAPEHALAVLGSREDGRCLDVIGPDGEVRAVRCGLEEFGPLLGWDERGILVLRFTSFGERLEILDPTDGRVIGRADVAMSDITDRYIGAVIDTERSGGRLIVRDEDFSVLWSVEAPDTYRISSAARHPSTADIALLDTAGRIIVIRPGDSEPRVWAQGLGRSYGEIVWQGTPLRAE